MKTNNNFSGLRLLLLGVLLIPVLALADGYGGGSGNGGGPPGDGDDPPDPCKGCNSGGGQPVNFYTGFEQHEKTDMVLRSVYPIYIDRKYSSGTRYDSPLGYGWSFSFDKRLYQYPDDSVVIRNGAQRFHFIKSAGAYITPAECYQGVLEEQVDGSFIFYHPNKDKDYFDAKGLLVKQQRADGMSLQYSYSAAKQSLTGVSKYSINPTQPMTVANTYQLEKIESFLADGTSSGVYADFTYEATTGRLDKITASDGRIVDYTHDVDIPSGLTFGNLTSVVDAEGETSTYQYADAYDPHNLTWWQIGAGTEPYINEYDTANGNDRVIKQTNGDGEMVIDYVVPGVQTNVTYKVYDPTGTTLLQSNTWQYVFNEIGYTSKVVDPLKNETRYVYNSLNWLIRSEYWQNTGTVATPVLSLLRTEDRRYNSEGRITKKITGKTTYPGGIVSEMLTPVGKAIVKDWEYDQGHLISETIYEKNENGNQVGQRFYRINTWYKDGNNVPVRLKDTKVEITPNNLYTKTRTYNTKGQLESISFPASYTLTYEYATGSPKPTKIYRKEGGVTASPYLEEEFEYDAYYNRKKHWDGKNNLTQYDYSSDGKIEKVTNALSEESIIGWTSAGLMDEMEFGKSGANAGRMVKFIWDTQKRVHQEQIKTTGGSFKTVITHDYDSAGRKISSTNADNETTTYAYNELNQLITVTDPDLKVTSFQYNMLGNVTKVTDGLNREKIFVYDDIGRLIKTEDKGITPSTITTFSYDAKGNLTSITDAKNNKTIYAYNGMGKKVSETLPSGDVIQYNYNSSQLLESITYPEGNKKEYIYFGWGGIEKIKFYDSSNTLQRTQTFAYDYAGNVTGVTDDGVQAGEMNAFTYDALNRLDTNIIKYLPGGNRTLDYSYNRFGYQSGLDFIDGATTYSHTNTMNVEAKWESASLSGQSYALAYTNDDRLYTLTHPNSVVETYDYEDNGALASINIAGSSAIENFVYAYNALNHISSITDNDGTTNYGYDGQNHLDDADFPAGSGLSDESFEYDSVGNRKVSATPNLWQYNANHQLTQDPNYTYSYDDNASMVSRTVLASPADPSSTSATFSYDATNRLVGYSNTTDSISASYLYRASLIIPPF